VGSIPDEVVDFFFFFNLPSPSHCNMALASNRNEYQKMFLGGNARPAR
jgi:hypothetical protein